MKKTLVLLLAAAGLAQADYVWQGGDTISNPEWCIKANWELTGDTKWANTDPGPGQTNSNNWDPIVVENAGGNIQNLEGWNLNLTLINSQLVVTKVAKFQTEGGSACYINIDSTSSLIINQFSGGNDGQPLYLNCEGQFTMYYDKNQGGAGTYADLGTTGMMKLLKHQSNTSTDGFTAKISRLEADLLDEVSFTLGEVSERVLIELTKGTSMNQLADNDIVINASDEWIRVGSADEVVNDGNKYYWVTQSQEGVKLSYVATAVTINMDHSGSMTAAGTMDFGSDLTTLTLMATLSDAQIAQLSNGEVITRTLLAAGNGILNYNDSVATNLTLSGVEGYNFVGQVMSADQLKEGEYGYVYSDTESADSISMVVKGKNGSAEAPDFGDGNVPEPTTATLSLMALAALAARRRRK